MNYGYNSFITFGPPKRIISEDRELNGFKETSVVEVWEVVAAGVPMFCMIQRQGTCVSTLDDLQRYGILTPNWTCLKELLMVWRHSFITGNDGVIDTIGVSWREFYNGIDESREFGTDYRVRFTTDDLDEEVGFLYSVSGMRAGIIRTHKDAVFFDSREFALLSMNSTGLQLQDKTFRDTVNYLIDLHCGDHLIAHLEKRVGESWVPQPEKQFVTRFIFKTEEYYDYENL